MQIPAEYGEVQRRSGFQRAHEPRKRTWLFLPSAFAHQVHGVVGREGYAFPLRLTDPGQ
jgi:hypothetical protein